MFTVYSKPSCVFCDMAKQLLTRQGEDFTEILAGRDIEMEHFKAMFPFVRTMPYIVEDTPEGHAVIGGFTELRVRLERSV